MPQGRQSGTVRRKTFPAARGVRWAWRDLPARVRSHVESRLGAKVRSVEVASEGFSPAFAGTVTDAAGRRTFLKAVGSAPNPDARSIYRHEVRNLRRLPEGLPVPKLLWHSDRDGWVILAFEAVAGRTPRLPWRPDELGRVLAAWGDLSARLTPAPEGFPTFARYHREVLRGWRRLASASDRQLDRATARFGPWWRDRLADLARIEAAWPSASAGNALLHSDIRADNVLLAGDRVVFVDWPHASVGAPWLDPLLMLPSVAMQGGPEPPELWGKVPGTERADPDNVRTMLVALAGFFVERSLAPPPPGLPTLRPFQRAQGEQALRWLRAIW